MGCISEFSLGIFSQSLVDIKLSGKNLTRPWEGMAASLRTKFIEVNDKGETEKNCLDQDEGRRELYRNPKDSKKHFRL